jgi:hypothetical protein
VAMFRRPAAGARDPFGESGAGSGELAVPVEGAVCGGESPWLLWRVWLGRCGVTAAGG